MERATPDSGCDCVDRLASLPVRAVCVRMYMHFQLIRPPAEQHEYCCRVLLQMQTAAAATKLYTVWKRQLVSETGATIHSTWIQCGMRVFECACKYARPNSLTYALARTICHTSHAESVRMRSRLCLLRQNMFRLHIVLGAEG